MEENKLYYTPSLEEFHIGFEYEFRQGSKWVNCKYNPNQTILGRKLEDLFRIKYLDQQDIESLGWKDGENYGLSGYVLNYATDDSYQMYYNEDNQFTQIYNWNSKIIFEGIIKNKSELKRLLKQLGINE